MATPEITIRFGEKTAEHIAFDYKEAIMKPEIEADITPTHERIELTPPEGSVFAKVTVQPIPEPTEETDIIENGDYDVSGIKIVHVTVQQDAFHSGDIVKLIHETIEVGPNTINNSGQLKAYIDGAKRSIYDSASAVMSIRAKQEYAYREYLGKKESTAYRYQNGNIVSFPYGSYEYECYCASGTIIDIYYIVAEL